VAAFAQPVTLRADNSGMQTKAAAITATLLAVARGTSRAACLRPALGYSTRFRLLLVIFAEVHHEEVRIISARRAEQRERKAYEASSREEDD
jgi:uncharacterized DUF497 family protein